MLLKNILVKNNIQLTDYISTFISSKGITDVFQMSGGMITQIIDKISQNEEIKVHSLFHEQSCAFAVSAYGRIHKKPSVALATSGPGATNLITGIGDCYFDSVPAIFITGQVNTHELKGERKFRQLGFQETDIVSIVKPITKYAIQLDENSNFEEIFELAYSISTEGRPGPVLIDIPMNVQRIKLTSEKNIISKVKSKKTHYLDSVYSALASSKKPLIWAGNGVHTSNSEPLFEKFVEVTKIPSVLTLHGIDLLPQDSEYRVGMIGSYGNRWANKSVSESDTILFLGSRIDIRQTGANMSLFENKKIIQIDIDNSEFNNRLHADISINMDLNDFLIQFLEEFDDELDFSDWLARINELKLSNPLCNELVISKQDINPHDFFSQLSINALGKRIYSVDVGSHQMWSAQALVFHDGDRFLTSGGMGSMGFSLPAAIGASVSTDKDIVVIVGDGSFQMNIQELQYISYNKLNIKIIVVNNGCLGMIRQFQDSYMEGRYFGTKWGYSTPNFSAISDAYGIQSLAVDSSEAIEAAISWLFKDKCPKLIDLKINSNVDVFPKIAFGQTMDKMEPEFKPREIEST
jgi:acetolactate synthase-1/2/3 large subunit